MVQWQEAGGDIKVTADLQKMPIDLEPVKAISNPVAFTASVPQTEQKLEQLTARIAKKLSGK